MTTKTMNIKQESENTPRILKLLILLFNEIGIRMKQEIRQVSTILKVVGPSVVALLLGLPIIS